MHGKTSGQERISLLLGNGKGAWVVMVPTAERDLKLTYSQTFLTKGVPEQGEGFIGLPRSEYTLERWSGVFQLLQLGSILLLNPDIIRRSKGELP